MEKLAKTFKKYGMDYEQVHRNDVAAVYKQSSDGKFISYEVMKIKVKEEGEMFGKQYPKRELLPSSEEWGNIAWTIRDYDRAMVKYERLTQRILYREPLNVLIKFLKSINILKNG